MSEVQENNGVVDSDLSQSENLSNEIQEKLDSVERGNTDKVDYTTLKRSIDKEKRVKAQYKEALTRLEKYEAAEKQAAEQELTQQNRWKELAQTREKETRALADELASMKKSEANSKRRKALINELGGVRREEYLNFADLDMIEIVDGRVDSGTVKAAAEQFRNNYSDLLSEPTKKSKITSRAASSNPATNQGGESDNIDDILNSIIG